VKVALAGRELEDEMTIRDYPIQTGTIVIASTSLVCLPGWLDVMDIIYVRNAFGQRYSLRARPIDQIAHVKSKIVSWAGIPVDQQRLLFMGQAFEDEKTLQDYWIGKHSTAFLLIHL
jgi:hypothetical protein